MKRQIVTDISEMDMFAFYDLDAELRDRVWCSFQWGYINSHFQHIQLGDFRNSILTNIVDEYAGPNINNRSKRIKNWKLIYYYHIMVHDDHFN